MQGGRETRREVESDRGKANSKRIQDIKLRAGDYLRRHTIQVKILDKSGERLR